MSRKAKTAFVTVGTTKFDELVAEVTKKETLDLLQQVGYENIIVQFGSGVIPKVRRPGLLCFDYKSDISKEMKAADLIISHGGAGSILEAVRCRNAKVIVVSNDTLLENHQIELAKSMHDGGHLLCTNIEGLQEAITRILDEVFVPFPDQDTTKFPELLNNILGWK
ncbi:UDP-N-acetylglucosamine transferase subunit ALG13-like [Tropilaelaps mercedesae]|uniref:UDP-N-acetylglucosamine transferase subunit ALG13 n=1 Tax=Tropilaelaps mercedesae TaxID=418985 RepID=A0A1V9XEX0_9ACAR|nr:UDP-N-acetylglucosamine transferase subunit ALG13-like [Tropilaelaps mercedesae]